MFGHFDGCFAKRMRLPDNAFIRQTCNRCIAGRFAKVNAQEHGLTRLKRLQNGLCIIAKVLVTLLAKASPDSRI